MAGKVISMNKAGKLAAIPVTMLVAILMTFLLPVLAAVSISLAPVSGVPGTVVSISGSADPDTWVAVKVLDETGSIVFFHTVESDGKGAYSCNFTAPDFPPGPLTVIAGYGTDVSQAVFTLTSRGGGSTVPKNNLPRTSNSQNLILATGLAATLAGALIMMWRKRGRLSRPG
jgi:LPXTG-motif cell wall-anchored protein